MRSEQLSRRERQIVDTLHALGEAGAREVAAAMGEPEALDSVRVTLAGLERKGVVRHRPEGRRHVYRPAESAERARRSAWARMTRTFFGGSSSQALLALLDMSRDRLGDDDLDRLAQWVDEQSRARKGR